jgi:flagellar hook-associated protein 3 FlgL
MITGLDSSSERFLNSLGLTQRRLEKAQLELASGKRLTVVSDDPDQISSLLQARADLGSAEQSQSDLSRVKTEVDTAESMMQNAVKLVEQARVLSTAGATGTTDKQTRTNLAQQLGDIMQQLVAITNTTVEGRNIFSGDSDQSAAYSIDLTQPVPTGTYLGTPATREIRHPNGTQFTVSKTAQEIFDSSGPGENVFAAINAMRIALQNNDQTGINSALPGIGSAGEYLNQQHAFYGGAQVRVNGAIEYGSANLIRLKTKIKRIEDTDMTAAVLELNQATFQQNVALSSRGKLPRTSLFDYLA